MTTTEIQDLICRYGDCRASGDTYHTTVLRHQIVEALEQLTHPAPPINDRMVEVLRELVAVADLKKSLAQASFHWREYPTDDNMRVVDELQDAIAKRERPGWDAARSLLEDVGRGEE